MTKKPYTSLVSLGGNSYSVSVIIQSNRDFTLSFSNNELIIQYSSTTGPSTYRQQSLPITKPSGQSTFLIKDGHSGEEFEDIAYGDAFSQSSGFTGHDNMPHLRLYNKVGSDSFEPYLLIPLHDFQAASPTGSASGDTLEDTVQLTKQSGHADYFSHSYSAYTDTDPNNGGYFEITVQTGGSTTLGKGKIKNQNSANSEGN